MADCQECGNKILLKPFEHKDRRFCSSECQAENNKKRISKMTGAIRGGGKFTAIIGGACECRVMADLFDKGYRIYRSMVPYGQGDVIAVKNNKRIMIEIKKGWFNSKGMITSTGGNETNKQIGLEFDVLAVVTPDLKVHYIPNL
jgi:hypothetical protein